MSPARFVFVAAAFTVSAGALAQNGIELRAAWARATPPGAEIGAAYLEIRNAGAKPDRLLSASTLAAKRVEVHVTQRDGDVMKMREVKALEVPARQSVRLEPGGTHLMLLDLAGPLKAGERFKLRLRFERGGEVETEVQVRALGARGHHH